MKSEHYPYEVAAIYPDGGTAAAAVDALDAAALDDVRVIEFSPDVTGAARAIMLKSVANGDMTAGNAVARSAAGTAPGAATAALFVSAPVIGPLIVLGYGAMLGVTAGAVRGLRLRRDLLAGLLMDALKAGYYVVILHAANNKVQQHAEAVINATLPAETAYYT